MTRKSEKTKELLIQSAIQLFYENGFEETTFKDIANAAGVTQPLLYSYVKNKMDLLHECCLYSGNLGREQILKFINPASSASKNLHQYLLGNLVWFKEDPVHAHIIFSMYYFAVNNPEIRTIYDLSQEKAVERIMGILEKGRKEGLWSGQKLKEKAQSIHSLLVGEVYKQFFPLSPISPEERAHHLAKDCLKLLKD